MKGRINMSDLIVRPRMLKSGKTVYEYAFEIARIDGKRKRKTKSGFRTKREAKEAGKIELSLYEKCGQTTKDTNISVADFFDLWMEKDCGLTCKESTLDGYHKKIRLYIKPSIGKYYLKNITKDILQDFIKDMYDKGFSKNTISSIRGIVTKAFRWAEEKHYIVASPATNLIIPRNQQPQKATITRQKPHIYVSEDRMKQIFERFPEKEPAHLPLMIIYHCGLRVGDDDDKIRLNQRKPSKYKGLRRFGPEKNLQRINKFMKERPIFYKNLIQMKENIRFYLRCFYCITKVMILQFNSENRTELARNG